MPADTEFDDNTPTQSDKIGWRRGLQQTHFRRLSADELRRYELEAKVIQARSIEQGEEDDENLGDRAAIIEECASHYYPRRTEMMSPKGANRRDEAVRIVDAARTFLEALDNASDITLDSLDDLGGEVGGSHRAVIKTLTAAAHLIGPAPAGRPSHEHLDDFGFELARMFSGHYDMNFTVEFSDAGEPITPASYFLWMLIRHFDPGVDEGSLRTAITRANTKLKKEIEALGENPP
jgi:hypothetical protein